MQEVSLVRLYVLRAAYVFIVVGLATTVWPPVLSHSAQWPLMTGVVCSLLAAVSVLAAFGIRYPLQMLPVLLFELIWKSIWLLSVAAPLWLADQMDAPSWSTVIDCLVGVVLMPIVIPWGYVFANYFKRRGDRWRPMTASDRSPAEART